MDQDLWVTGQHHNDRDPKELSERFRASIGEAYTPSPDQIATVQALWRSDADPGGLPALPTGVTPQFLAENGGVQGVTDQLRASATASGFGFPSNLTVQVQSDAPEVVPEPASIALCGLGAAALVIFRRRK